MTTNKIEIHPINTAEADVSEGLDLWLNPSEETRTVPIITYLITGVDGVDGPILIDTGLKNADRATNLMGLGDHRTKPEWDLIKQLKELNTEPSDIENIIFTHLHYEHVAPAYIREFSNATIYIQKKELEHAAVPKGGKNIPVGGDALFYDRRDVELLCSELWDRVELFDGNHEFTPNVKCVLYEDTHTPGHQAIYVEIDGKTIIITGDLIRSVELNIEKQYPPAIFYNLNAMQDALARLKKEGDIYLPTHDPAILDNEKYP